MFLRFSFILCACVLLFTLPAQAAGKGKPPPQIEWGFDGPFGTYDRAALQRGYQVYRNVCAACHGMKHLAYRNLTALGYDEEQVKNIASQYSVTDGPNDEGEMFERPAIPADRMLSPFANEQAARYANGGAYPPDLSLMIKARKDGSNYMKALLVGYEDPPAGKTLLPGQYYNKYMAGNVIAMAPPLSDDLIPYEDDTPQTVEQYSKDVTYFLTWAADPYMEQRKTAGFRVMMFLLIFAGLMYAVKKKIWADVH